MRLYKIKYNYRHLKWFKFWGYVIDFRGSTGLAKVECLMALPDFRKKLSSISCKPLDHKFSCQKKKENDLLHPSNSSKYRTLKHAFLTWIKVRNRSPTKNRLRNWGLNVSSKCLLCVCRMNQETISSSIVVSQKKFGTLSSCKRLLTLLLTSRWFGFNLLRQIVNFKLFISWPFRLGCTLCGRREVRFFIFGFFIFCFVTFTSKRIFIISFSASDVVLFHLWLTCTLSFIQLYLFCQSCIWKRIFPRRRWTKVSIKKKISQNGNCLVHCLI